LEEIEAITVATYMKQLGSHTSKPNVEQVLMS
jgi:hypothetical protein